MPAGATSFNTILLGFVVVVQTLGMLYALHATKTDTSLGHVMGVIIMLLLLETLSLLALRKAPIKDSKSGQPLDIFASLLAGTAISVFIVSPILIVMGIAGSWARHPGLPAVAIPVLATAAFYGSLFVADKVTAKWQ